MLRNGPGLLPWQWPLLQKASSHWPVGIFVNSPLPTLREKRMPSQVPACVTNLLLADFHFAPYALPTPSASAIGLRRCIISRHTSTRVAQISGCKKRQNNVATSMLGAPRPYFWRRGLSTMFGDQNRRDHLLQSRNLYQSQVVSGNEKAATSFQGLSRHLPELLQERLWVDLSLC